MCVSVGGDNECYHLFTARVRSTTGRYCFHRCLSVHRGGGGVRSGTPPGGVPGPPRGVPRSRYPPRGVPRSGYPPRGVPGSGTPPGGYPGPGTPRGGTQTPGGYPGPGTPPGGYPGLGTPGGTWPGYPPRGGVPGPPRGGTQVQVPPRGGTRVGQQKEYSLHGGRYASCVHAGGLSCLIYFYRDFFSTLILMVNGDIKFKSICITAFHVC